MSDFQEILFPELEEFLIPRSCLSSLRHGPQRLASGVEVYCEDGWTVSENVSTFIREVPQTVLNLLILK